MKEIYKDLNALKGIQEPFKSALVILQDMYVNGPENKAPISEGLPLHMAINAAQHIYETVKNNLITYVPVLNSEIRKIFKGINYRDLTFETFQVPNSSELACIMGCAYYAMALDEDFDDNQLENIEKIIIAFKPENIPSYFNVFKRAAEERKKTQNAPSQIATSNNDVVEKLQKECKLKDKEIKKLKSILKEYTDEEVTKDKPYFTTNQITIALYFLLDNAKIRILDNQSGWALFFSKIVRRSIQNIRGGFSNINKDLSSMKKDAAVVADAFDAVAPVIAEKIRKNCDIVVTTKDK